MNEKLIEEEVNDVYDIIHSNFSHENSYGNPEFYKDIKQLLREYFKKHLASENVEIKCDLCGKKKGVQNICDDCWNGSY